ncbi:MAG: N-acetyltransferase [Rhodobacteraceae bacterium]|nr:MAG: N-acetyltransferase [Paracoccaceae bacterium]
MIRYAQEPALAAADFADLLLRSGLAPRRPAEPERLAAMLRNAQLVIAARADGELVGLARSITDWSYCLYCSDLCVDAGWQGQGIGMALLAETADAAPEVQTCLLLSAPGTVSFYEAAGYPRHDGAFVFKRR